VVVILKYTKTNGSHCEEEYEDDVLAIRLYSKSIAEIDLSPLNYCTKLKELKLLHNSLQSIDLSPLSSCTELQELWLDDNEIQNIDLSPLSSCTELQELWLDDNEIQNIDLSPLSLCTKLRGLSLSNNRFQNIDLSFLSSCVDFEILWLAVNKLQSIDLSPLRECTKLEMLRLDHNQLQEIDLSPLSTCFELEDLNLERNQIQHIDLTPLSSCRKLESLLVDIGVKEETILSREQFKGMLLYDYDYLKVDVPVPMTSLAAVEYAFPLVREEPAWKTFHLFNEALSILDLDWLGRIDGDPTSFLDAILTTERVVVGERTLEMLVPVVCQQIDDRKTTIGLDIERAITENREFHERVDRVRQLRLEELERVRVIQDDEGIDLRRLWMTAYGHQILTTLGLGMTCTANQFEKVRRAVAKLGIELEIVEDGDYDYPTDISDSLTRAILLSAIYATGEYPDSS
jgi:hypothetical protein